MNTRFTQTCEQLIDEFGVLFLESYFSEQTPHSPPLTPAVAPVSQNQFTALGGRFPGEDAQQGQQDLWHSVRTFREELGAALFGGRCIVATH